MDGLLMHWHEKETILEYPNTKAVVVQGDVFHEFTSLRAAEDIATVFGGDLYLTTPVEDNDGVYWYKLESYW
jgi:hypothetical protein